MKQLKTYCVFAIAVLAVFFSSLPSVLAQQSEAGPFVNKFLLINYWQFKSASSPAAHDVALNGQLVFSRPGPQAVKVFTYFQCGDGLIYAKCNDIKGPYRLPEDMDGITAGLAGAGQWRALLDSVQRAQSGAGPYTTEFHFVTCPGSDPRFTYFMLSQATTSDYGNFGPYPGTLCLPLP